MPQTASTSSGILDVIDQRPTTAFDWKLGFLAIVFVYRFVAEAKGLPVEDIVGLSERPSSAGTAQALVPDARG